MFTDSELRFIEKNELCRLATADENNQPHVVPVAYLFKDMKFYIATDYGTKKLANIKKNKRVALVVDVYKPNKAVMVLGEASILEKGPEYREVYKLFYRKFAWVRSSPWSEGEAPFIVVRPVEKVSWGL
ncbi:MAG: pyridoxamine 5'-phosphate oxidase family protein [Candidatus Caldarchaeum sp.]